MDLHADSFDNDDDEFDDDDFDDPNHLSLYLKYEFDGASNIAELQTCLRGFADYLDCQIANGWRLEHAVDSGWVHLRRDAIRGPGRLEYGQLVHQLDHDRGDQPRT